MDAIAATIPPTVLQRLSAGAGSKGARIYQWAWTDLLRIGWPGWRHALLVREHVRTGQRAYYVVFAPASATLKEVVDVAGARWAIEQGFEATKQGVGLDEYEVRKYDGWYRYITLALCAHAVLAAVRAAMAAAKARTKRGAQFVRPDRPRSSR